MPLNNTFDSVPTKQCSKCKEFKPATTEYFGPRKSSRDGFRSHCNACRKAFYQANLDRLRAKNRDYRTAHKDERNAVNRAYYQRNKEKAREYQRTYIAANREKVARSLKAYKAANREFIAQINRKWRVENRERFREISQQGNFRRRKRQRAAPGHHTAKDVKRIYKIQEGRCFYCHCDLGEVFHTDHVIPLSRGGSDGIENIVVACPSCNLSKASKMPHEWDGPIQA